MAENFSESMLILSHSSGVRNRFPAAPRQHDAGTAPLFQKRWLTIQELYGILLTALLSIVQNHRERNSAACALLLIALRGE